MVVDLLAWYRVSEVNMVNGNAFRIGDNVRMDNTEDYGKIRDTRHLNSTTEYLVRRPLQTSGRRPTVYDLNPNDEWIAADRLSLAE